MQAVHSRRSGGAGRFFAGFFTGLIFAAALAVAGGVYLVKHPKAVSQVVAKQANQVVRKTLDSVPKDLLAQRQAEISELFSRFVKAYSAGRVSAQTLEQLSQSAFAAAADQKVTAVEIDDLLDQLRRAMPGE